MIKRIFALVVQRKTKRGVQVKDRMNNLDQTYENSSIYKAMENDNKGGITKIKYTRITSPNSIETE